MQQARHEEMTKTHALEKEIREIELHYEHVPEVMKNVGNAEERKVCWWCHATLSSSDLAYFFVKEGDR